MPSASFLMEIDTDLENISLIRRSISDNLNRRSLKGVSLIGI